MVCPPIIIVGMHRSGTSCLAGSLQQAGLRLGDVHTANPYNRKGNREHPALMALHDKVLADNGASWHEPPRGVVQWQSDHLEQRDAIIGDIAAEGPWGFKDPRTLLVLDEWLARFPGAQLVGTLRHPLAVAESLQRRSPALMSLEGYLALWTDYNRRLLQLWQTHRFTVLDFDKPDEAYQADLNRLLRQLGLAESRWARLRRLGLKGLLSGSSEQAFFDPALRSQRREGEEGLPADTLALYRELKAIAL